MAVAAERAFRYPTYFDNKGKLAIAAPVSERALEAKANKIDDEAAHAARWPEWTTINGHIVQIPMTGLVEYLTNPRMLDANTYGDESSPRYVDDIYSSHIDASPLRKKYMDAYLSVLGRKMDFTPETL